MLSWTVVASIVFLTLLSFYGIGKLRRRQAARWGRLYDDWQQHNKALRKEHKE